MAKAKNGDVVAYEQSDVTLTVGPIPDPETLGKYDIVQPGLAGRIVAMAETQMTHRIDMESRVIKGAEARANRGQIFAAVLSVAAFGLAFWLVSLGQYGYGAGIVTGTLVSLAGVFVYGTRSQRKERVEKEKIRDEIRRN